MTSQVKGFMNAGFSTSAPDFPAANVASNPERRSVPKRVVLESVLGKKRRMGWNQWQPFFGPEKSWKVRNHRGKWWKNLQQTMDLWGLWLSWGAVPREDLFFLPRFPIQGAMDITIHITASGAASTIALSLDLLPHQRLGEKSLFDGFLTPCQLHWKDLHLARTLFIIYGFAYVCCISERCCHFWHQPWGWPRLHMFHPSFRCVAPWSNRCGNNNTNTCGKKTGFNRWATDGLILPAWYYPPNGFFWNQTYPVPSPTIAINVSFPRFNSCSNIEALNYTTRRILPWRLGV